MYVCMFNSPDDVCSVIVVLHTNDIRAECGDDRILRSHSFALTSVFETWSIYKKILYVYFVMFTNLLHTQNYILNGFINLLVYC